MTYSEYFFVFIRRSRLIEKWKRQCYGAVRENLRRCTW